MKTSVSVTTYGNKTQSKSRKNFFRRIKGTPLDDLAKVKKSATSVLRRFSPNRLDQNPFLKNHSIALFKLNKIGYIRSDYLISIGDEIDYCPRIAQ
jgi:hypothetical protein